ncbi:MAG: hypothetical protein AAF928_06475 [Myxococcota bacterium]
MGRWLGVGGGLAVLTGAASVGATPQFEAVDGYVVMEAESVPAVMGWQHDTPADAMAEKARGDVQYFNDQDASICSTPRNKAEGFPALEYRFRVHQAGVYWVKMNMRKQVHCVAMGNDGNSCHNGAGCQSFGIQADGDSCNGNDRCWRSDISNDAYVAMETDGGTGVPYIGGNTQIMKLFGGKADEYGWSGNGALDHNPPTYELAPGDYVFKVRGRSRGLKIDRIIIFHEDADENTAKSAPETAYVDPGTGGGGPGGGDPVGPSSSGSTGGMDGGGPSGSGAGTPGGGDDGTGGSPSSANGADTEADSGCAVSPGNTASSSPMRGMMLLIMGAAGWLSRRRRRRS